MARLPHEWDNDACCIHCGFDGCEEYHLRVMCTPDYARPPEPDYARYCPERRVQNEQPVEAKDK